MHCCQYAVVFHQLSKLTETQVVCWNVGVQLQSPHDVLCRFQWSVFKLTQLMNEPRHSTLESLMHGDVQIGSACCCRLLLLWQNWHIFNSPLFLGFAELSNSTNSYVHTPAPTYIWCVKLNEHGHQVSLKESLVAKTEFDALASSNKPFGTLQCVIFPEAQVLLHNKECSPIPSWICMSFCLHMQTSSSCSKC